MDRVPESVETDGETTKERDILRGDESDGERGNGGERCAATGARRERRTRGRRLRVAAVSARVGIQPDPEARRRVSQGTAVEISERSRRARGVGVDGIQRRGEIEPIRRAVAIRLLSGSHKGARSRAVRRCVARGDQRDRADGSNV